MTDFLFQATVSNLVVTTLLAILAWFVQRHLRSAALANVLWALVLIKMVTPPLFSVPVFEIPAVMASEDETSVARSNEPIAIATLDAFPTESSDWSQPAVAKVASTPNIAQLSEADEPASSTASLWAGILIALWAAVSALLMVVSSHRILQFHRLFRATSRLQEAMTAGICRDIARRLKLNRTPDLFVTTANVAPFVWWRAGRAIVVVSDNALQNLAAQDLRFVLTHEMAHIKRRDHWFRWLEWLAVIGFWWNPVMWWTRTQLRVSEEIACDELVLETTRSKVHPYANSLLNVAELLTNSAIRPPSVASAINGGGTLEKRLKTMIAGNSWKVPSSMRWCILSAALGMLPLGLVGAQDFEAVEKRLGGAVEAGELSLEQASLLMKTLRQSTGEQGQKRSELANKKREYMAFTEDIKAAVEAGKLSAEEGEHKVIIVRGELFGENEEKQSEHNQAADAKRNRYAALAEKIKKAVDADVLSQIQGDNKSIAIRMEMFDDLESDKGEHGEKPEQHRIEIRKNLQLDLTDAIKDAIQSGTVSSADGKARILGLRMKASSDDHGEHDHESHTHDADERPHSIELKQLRGKEISDAIRQAMKLGQLSKEDAEHKIMSVRVEMLSDLKEALKQEEKHASGDASELKEHALKTKVLKQEKQHLESALKSGKRTNQIVDGDISIFVEGNRISTEKDGERHHSAGHEHIADVLEIVKGAVGGGPLENIISNEDVEIRVEVLDAHGTADLTDKKPTLSSSFKKQGTEAQKQRLVEVTKEIQAAVESARNAANKAREHRVEVHVEVDANHETDPKIQKQDAEGRKRELDAKKQRYTEITKEIDAAVKAGKLSEEQAQRKRIEIRTQMFRSPATIKTPSKKAEKSQRVEIRAIGKRVEENQAKEKSTAERNERLALQVAKQRRLEEATRRIRIAIEKGELTKEQGEAKILEIRDAMFGDKD